MDILGENRYLLLFIHAITGCDTTSRPFGIGKAAAFKKIRKSPEMKRLAAVFYETRDRNVDNILSAGEKVIVHLYGGNMTETWDEFRFRNFCKFVAFGTTFVQVQTLPPVLAATKFHSLRVYYQVQEWLGTPPLDPTLFRWKTEN